MKQAKAINKSFYDESIEDLNRPIRIDSIEDSLFVNLFVSHQAARRTVDKICIKNGITGPQYNILRTLQAYGGSSTVKPLQRGMLSKASAVTRLIDKLIVADCVKRYAGRQDRRIVDIKITKKGERLVNNITKEVYLELEKSYSHMSKNEIKQLIRLLKKARKFMM